MGKNYGLILLIVILGLNPINESVAQTKYSAPSLSKPESWSMILVPDPQSYVKFERNAPILDLMTAWISENTEALNIRMVLCTGDLVEQNEMPNPNGTEANQSSRQQWKSVSNAFGRLDGKTPYVTAVGNHDFGYKNISHRRSNFVHYFPEDKNPLTKKMLREVGINGSGIPSMENAAFEFRSPHGKDFLILTLEFAPRDTIIYWAKTVIAQPKYKDHFVILLTHSYMNAKNEHIVKENYPVTDANYGAAIWEKLVKPSTNIRMVFAGHIGSPDNARGHVAFRTDKNAAGKTVQQMVFNAQAMGGGWNGNGGDGWLRILEFLPDGKTVQVKTFSPFFAISPTTQPFAWRTESYDQFSFPID